VLVEAGIAIALKKKICIACRTLDDLPFLLRGAQGHHSELAPIAIVQWEKTNPEPALVADMLLDYCSQKLNIPQ
jgi:hypothetical protein